MIPVAGWAAAATAAFDAAKTGFATIDSSASARQARESFLKEGMIPTNIELADLIARESPLASAG